MRLDRGAQFVEGTGLGRVAEVLCQADDDSDVAYESEGVVRVRAEGDRLVDRGVRQWTEARVARDIDIPRGYLAGEGPFPERLPWLILCGEFLSRFTLLAGEWADWAADVVESWPDDLEKAEPDWPALEGMANRSDAYLQHAAKDRRASTAANQLSTRRA